jgi:hypothetical protein
MTANDHLLKAQQKIQEMREAGWKPVLLNPIEKARANPNSLKLAIRAHCWECNGRDADPHVKLRVRDCTIKDCPLWPHRPWQDAVGELPE